MKNRMINLKDRSFKRLMQDYQNNVPRAFGYPVQIIDNDDLHKELLSKPKKYANWLIWILKTAPKPKSDEEKKCKDWIKNFLCESLSVNEKFDYIDDF